MHPTHAALLQSRRNFLATSASGVGLLAVASLLQENGLLAATPEANANPLAPQAPHFAPRAKACICIYLEGAPSQVDLFDPKPKLNELHGQKLPDSMTEKVRFAFIQKEGGRLLGSRASSPSTASAAWTSPISAAPRHLCRRHRSGSLDAHRGVQPSSGSADDEHRRAHVRPADAWARGSTTAWARASKNLPGYVVLTAGRGTSAGASALVERLPADHLSGRALPQPGRTGARTSTIPTGLPGTMQQKTIECAPRLNGERHAAMRRSRDQQPYRRL